LLVRAGHAVQAAAPAAAAYVLAWLLIPEAGQDQRIISKALADKRGIALGGRHSLAS
jgi:hypothetical protein